MEMKFVFLVLFVQLTVAGASVAKPNCKDQCGNVSIPYPFGMGKDCSMNPWFQVGCRNDTIPFLTSIDMEVLYVDVIQGAIRVKSRSLFPNCSGSSRIVKAGNYMPLNLTGSPFFFSVRNAFTALGCNTRAFMAGTAPQYVGCESTCRSQTAVYHLLHDHNISGSDGYLINKCSNSASYNCCQSTIPPFLQVFQPGLVDINNDDNGKGGCKVAFLADADWIYKKLEDPNDVKHKEYVPLLLNWFWESTSWNYSIKNAACFAVNKVSSFSGCHCLNGYYGDPYVGCKVAVYCRKYQRSVTTAQGQLRCQFDFAYMSFWGAMGFFALGFLYYFTRDCLLSNWSKEREVERRRKKFFKENGGLLLQQQLSSSDNIQSPKIFGEKELEKATDGFRENRVLGHGGQGAVYKGMLEDGRIVAVKKSKLENDKQRQEFVNEIVILAQISHRNVVKILGCCLETEVPLLVYEFVPNGSLSHHLHGQYEEVLLLSWEKRLEIASEVAGSLAYLHSAITVPVFHRDIKSTNILLDEKFRAKISDFGISRLVGSDKTHLTTRVVGTFGYFDPEYFQSKQFTDKSDVYSFGVVLIELLSGQKPIFFDNDDFEEPRSLITHFFDLMIQKKYRDIVDARIWEQCHEEEIIELTKLIKRCLNLRGKNRPTMKEVVMRLQKLLESRKKSSNAQREETNLVVGNSVSCDFGNILDLSFDEDEQLDVVSYKTW